MALVYNSGGTYTMALHTNNDNESNWSGTDGPDTYNVSIQGTNSESWLVSKNTSETGQLSLSNDISGSGNQFMLWMKSDLSYYYTSVKVQLISTAGNYREYTLATSSAPHVSGDFKPFVLDIVAGTQTGTFVPASYSQCDIIVDNSSSGNIRSVINNWIDAIYYGNGLSFTGSDVSDIMFTEAAAIDQNGTNEYGILENYNNQIFCQGSLSFDDGGATVTQTSNGENLVFKETLNGTNQYTLELLGDTNTVSFINSNISAVDTARFDFVASGTINSFSMVGGNMVHASSVAFKSGQTHSGINFTECGEVDTNGATISGCSFIDTIETTTGALIVNSEIEGESCSDLTFTGYSNNSRHAIYVDASVTEFDMDNWYFDDPNNTTDYALYWAGTSGTLTVNALNGTNLLTAGCEAASGGSVIVVSGTVTTGITVKDLDTNAFIESARVYLEVTSGVNFPYQASVTITGTGTTATVSHGTHGMSTGDFVVIKGATPDVYNGQYQITVTTASEYTYTTNETIATSPATGTITSTFLIVSGLTNSSGYISDSRVVGVDQTISGWVRKSTASPYYRQGNITDTVDDVLGLNVVVLLSKDE